MTIADKKTLRRQMRERRRALSAPERATAAERFADKIWPLLQRPDCQHVAVYLAVDGELDLQPLIERLWAAHKQVYLPVVTQLAPGQLRFARYRAGSRMKANRFGILEPCAGAMIRKEQLDVVLLPLTAFDHTGARLGMGGGFYDRTFACRRASLASRPCLIGAGYRWQQVAQVVREPHDLPVQAIVTD